MTNVMVFDLNHVFPGGQAEEFSRLIQRLDNLQGKLEDLFPQPASIDEEASDELEGEARRIVEAMDIVASQARVMISLQDLPMQIRVRKWLISREFVHITVGGS